MNLLVINYTVINFVDSTVIADGITLGVFFIYHTQKLNII